MDLKKILEKTKTKAENIVVSRRPPSIAIDDRPYSIQEINHSEILNRAISNSPSSFQKTANNDAQETVNKPETNHEQTINKLETNRKQTVNNINRNRKQTVTTTVNRTVNKLETNCKQTVNNVMTNSSFSYLTGLQRSSVIFVYEECKANRGHTTNFVSLEHIANHLNTSVKATKTTIQRLVKKGCLVRIESKAGRGGWTKYMLPEIVFKELLHNETVNKLETNRKQTVTTTVNTTVNKVPSSSSSYINNKKTTTTTTEIPDNWLNIDLEDGGKFGFTKNHLIQLYKEGGLDPQMIQDSIEHFAFDLEHNGKSKEIKTNPLSYFMGIMRRVGVYNAPENYESPKAKALRLYLEKKKMEQEQKAAIEKEFLNCAFQEWLDGISEEEKNKIIPDDIKRMNLKAPRIAALRSYFENTIWQTKKNEILKIVDEE